MELHTSGVTSDPNHPESPLRIIAIMAELTKTGLAARCTTVPPRKATEQEIRACHHGPYVDLLLTIPTMDSAMLFATAHSYNSVYLNNQSLDAALWSAGCVAQMAEHVWTGKIRNGFAVVRPPGHHAESHQAMGFCLLDNVAIAARMLIQKFKVARILIIDWDVHHGNGIQQLFYSDPQVLYVSLHRFDNGTFFPVGRGGAPERIGEGKGLGRNMNIGWPSAGMKDGDYLYAFTELIMPVAYEFDPDIVIVASGFDAAEGDPLGGCHVSPAGYHQLTHLLSGLAQGKLVVALEGGYNVKSISRSAAAVCSALLGDPAPRLAGPSVPSKGGMRAVEDTMRCLAPYWKCLKGKVPAGGASLEDAFGGLGISS
ncbi:hypothetical protein DFJ74DRAFT_602021 [Hyaloraphidium curvatum]|nr:hypothetical protein DFJ74DRAFT_602021 [Hyaloraphidium curvatum]